MKLTLLTIGLLALALSAQAQTTTNIAYRVTVETVSAGVTNSVNTNFRWDAGTKKDAAKIDGLALAYSNYVTQGGTDTFGQWLKTDINDRAKAYADVKQQADYAALLAKLTALLTGNIDLLNSSDIDSLNTIAAKAP